LSTPSRIIIALILASLILAACGSTGPGGAGDDALFSRSTTVARDRIQVTVSGTGELEASALATLSFKAEGSIGAVNASVGQQVTAGQVLLELDPGSLDASLASAKAELIQAEQALDEAEDLNNWQIALAQARQQLAMAEDALDDAEYYHRVRQQGNRASQDTINAAEARLVLAERSVDRAKAEYDKYSGRDSDDPSRAVALTNLVNARQERDSARRTLNWYTGAPTEIEQAQLDADVAVAEANLEKARERVEILEQGPDPDQVEAAQARVDAARARANQANLDAPFAGTVMAVNYSLGDSVTPGQPAVVLADLSQLHVETSIDELDVASVEIGQPATITLDALPQVRLDGEVEEIDLIPSSLSSTTEYPLRVALVSVDDQARVGMTVTVNVLVADVEDTLVVPNWALRFDAETGDVYVNVEQDGGIERRAVELGLRNESISQITNGLQEGDIIGVVSDGQTEENSFRGPFGG
jgi:HlyD family secretion protein